MDMECRLGLIADQVTRAGIQRIYCLQVTRENTALVYLHHKGLTSRMVGYCVFLLSPSPCHPSICRECDPLA